MIVYVCLYTQSSAVLPVSLYAYPIGSVHPFVVVGFQTDLIWRMDALIFVQSKKKKDYYLPYFHFF